MTKQHAAVFKLILVIGCFATPFLAAAGNFYEEKPTGFLWYTDPILMPKKDNLSKVQPPIALSVVSAARERNKTLSQNLDDAIQVMVDNPTVENAIKAQWLQKQVMERSEQVSKSWVLASLLDAGLLKLEDNQNVLHRELQKDSNSLTTTKNLKIAANDWGIIFYWMQGCIYCQRFIPIIEEVQKNYGFKVLAVSQDGGNFGPFEGQKDTGLINNLNPAGEAPLLFLIRKDGKEIYPIARGITDLEQIGQNILMVIKYSKGTLQ